MSNNKSPCVTNPRKPEPPAQAVDKPQPPAKPQEIGGPRGLEPTRYGDWEKAGRCIDF
ncbi:MAG: DUF1674 domain-containing protein [Gammaproteobacteria bacterium]|nr:DUF1674 domain-containing protein [Gammaproteobacteria bacterium]MDE2345692.1 DUF1674 domain-containing protein [Gammaproteobacteria bacterium]